MELRASPGEQRIRGEELQGFLHGREVACAVIGDVALSVVIVVANAAEMSEELARSDGGIFLREGGTIFLDGSVEVELAALVELQDGYGGNGLGGLAEGAERGGRSGGEGPEGCPAETRVPERVARLGDLPRD